MSTEHTHDPLLSDEQVYGVPGDGLDEGLNREEIRDRYEAELHRLRSMLSEIVDQADEGMPIADVSPCIVKASKYLSK
jgi:hypothetical protein